MYLFAVIPTTKVQRTKDTTRPKREEFAKKCTPKDAFRPEGTRPEGAICIS